MKNEFLKLMQSDSGYVAKYNEYTKDIQLRARKLTFELNNISSENEEWKREILRELFWDEKVSVCLETPFHCDYGFNIHFEGFALINYNCTILDTSPVYIGEGSIIGAGSVVSKDIPDNVIAAGAPCKVIREITDEDRLNLESDMRSL